MIELSGKPELTCVEFPVKQGSSCVVVAFDLDLKHTVVLLCRSMNRAEEAWNRRQQKPPRRSMDGDSELSRARVRPRKPLAPTHGVRCRNAPGSSLCSRPLSPTQPATCPGGDLLPGWQPAKRTARRARQGKAKTSVAIAHSRPGAPTRKTQTPLASRKVFPPGTSRLGEVSLCRGREFPPVASRALVSHGQSRRWPPVTAHVLFTSRVWTLDSGLNGPSLLDRCRAGKYSTVENLCTAGTTAPRSPFPVPIKGGVSERGTTKQQCVRGVSRRNCWPVVGAARAAK